MSSKKTKCWMWQMSTYTPPAQKVESKTDNGKCVELVGVEHPFRQGRFSLYWLEPFLPGRVEYWDVKYVRPEL